MSNTDQKKVTEDDLRSLFKELINDLTSKIRSGDATGKDKEIAMKLIESFNVGVTLEDAQPLAELSNDLPFNEMRHQ